MFDVALIFYLIYYGCGVSAFDNDREHCYTKHRILMTGSYDIARNLMHTYSYDSLRN